MTRLPRMCPHFFGQSWCSRKQPAPGSDQLLHGTIDVQRVAVAGVGVDDDRDVDAQADPPGPSVISVCVSRPMSGSPMAVAATE